MRRPQDAIPGIFRPPTEWRTDPPAIDRAVQDVLTADARSAPARRTAMQLVDHFTVHDLTLPPNVRTALAKAMRVRRAAATLDRQQALARGEVVDVEDRSKQRLRNRPEPVAGTRAALWATIEQHAERGEPLPRDVWWAVSRELDVEPPRVRQRLVDIREWVDVDGERHGEFVWQDMPPEKRYGKRHRDDDHDRAMDIEAYARIVRGQSHRRALSYPTLAKLARIEDDQVIKTWATSSAWKLGTSAIALYPIRDAIEHEAMAMMRGRKMTVEELATWVRVPGPDGRLAPIDVAIVKAWRRELSAEQVARLIVAEAAAAVRLRDPSDDPVPELAKLVDDWWDKDDPWDLRVQERHELLRTRRAEI